MKKRLSEIQSRKLEIRTALDAGGEVELEKVQTELAALEVEERSINERIAVSEKINVGTIIPKPIAKPDGETRATGTDSLEYRKAFMEYVLKGTAIPVELRIDASTTLSDIGTVIPQTIMDRIIDKLESTGMILPLVTRTAYKGGVSIPTSALKPVATWVNEGAGSDLQQKTTTNVTFAYFKLRCAVSVSLEVSTIAMSVFETAVVNNITEAMVKAIEQAIISGVNESAPTGIIHTAAESGQVIVGTPEYAKIVEAEGALPLAYDSSAVWCMTKKTFMQFIGQVDDLDQPVARVNFGITGKPERVLLGRPVVLCDYLESYASNLTTGHVWAFMFDFKDYVLNTNLQMTIKKYEDYTTDDIVTKAIMLVDGKKIDNNSLVTLTKS